MNRYLNDPELLEFEATDGYVWNYRHFATNDQPLGTIVVLHGIQSHSGWYLESASQLAESGWNVSLLDRRGSGMNQVDRGDAPTFRRLLDDIAEFLQRTAPPRILLGISWGGKLAVALQRHHPGLCERLILVAPGFTPRVKLAARTRLAILASRCCSPKRKFAIPLNEPELFTANAARQLFIARDTSALRVATARLLMQSARLDLYLRRCKDDVTIPTLTLLAGQDRIIDNAKTRQFVAQFRGKSEVIEYAEAHHTLEFEKHGPPFVKDVLNWLNLAESA